MKEANAAQSIIVVFIAYMIIYAFSFGVSYTLSRLIWAYNCRSQYKNFNNFYENFKKQKWNNDSMGMSVNEACKILGIKKNTLNKMSKNDLKKAYWKKAQEVHPDKPTGNEESFKNVNNAYAYIKTSCYA